MPIEFGLFGCESKRPTHLWDEALFAGLIVDAIHFAVVTFILIPTDAASALVRLCFAAHFARFLCKDFVLSLETTSIHCVGGTETREKCRLNSRNSKGKK